MIIRYARLSLPFDIKAMQTEIAQLGHQWQAHFNTFYYEGSWTALALRSPGGSNANITPDLMTDADFRDTLFMQHFPSVIKLISAIDCPVMAVRFLKLEAGAVIKQHRDNELAFEKGEARLHFPVITNLQVMFYIEDERVPLQEGESWYINANLPHRVSNEGLTDRIHLVVDCKVNDWLSQVVNGSDKISFKEEHTQSDLPKMINELRLQNTAASHKLAAELEQQLSGNTAAN
jgi:mannose-6-phosphate isomerase-like protein (cupin superfamily)